MSAREELEAVIWRHWPTCGPEAGEAVDAILDGADAYAVAVAVAAEDTAEATAVRRTILQRYGLQGRRAS